MDYQREFFTEYGLSTLENYIKSLSEIFINTPEDQFPFKVCAVFDIPNFKYGNTFVSRQDLLGRIKAYGVLLGLESITITDNKGNKRIIQLEV